MYRRIIRNDFGKSKWITLITMGFVAAAAMLVSLVAMLVVSLSGAIDSLMTQSKTPHFLQMHSGVIDTARMQAFAEQNRNVAEFQVLEFLNVDSAQIVIGGRSLADSVQDNGFSTQSKKFDYLLDLNGKPIQVSDGEVYVPISYIKNGSIQIGDKAVIFGKEFTVAGLLRDSQMNSLLASSKRFLVSDNDYSEIKDFGNKEYLIEFRLKDLSALGAFQTAYTSAGLEANGPTITYSLFKMLNAISDGLMIAVILLVSILVVAVALMCIRFTLLATIEDDYREIGVMKAIGLRVSDIKKIYLAKYAAVAAAGSILGFALSLVFRGRLQENIRLYMGESRNSFVGWFIGILGVLLVFLAIISYVSRVLKRFQKISAVESIRFGTTQEKLAGAQRWRLSRCRRVNTNIFLGIKDVLSRKRLYATMLAVLVISAFIMLVPYNLYNTISSKTFITYMGMGKSDIRFDLQQTSHISEKTAEIAKALKNDGAISRFTVLTTKTFTVRTEGGSEERIKIELGDHSIFPLQYSAGRAPATADEIALSVLNADGLGLTVGDVLTLFAQGKEKKLTVSGMYSDITNGGKTAKAVFTDNSAGTMWSVICAELADKSVAGSKVSEYAEKYAFAKVSGIDEYITQTFGSTIDSVGTAARAAIVVALIITVLVTLLFMKLLVAKNRHSIAILKALGYRNPDLVAQYVTRSVFVLLVGIVIGTLLANTLGESLAGAVISSFGASSFTFVINPLSAYLLYPLMLVCSVLIATIIGTSGVQQIRISEHIKE